MPININIMFDQLLKTKFSDQNRVNATTLRSDDLNLQFNDYKIKRILDVCASAFLLIILMPVFLMIGFLIKLDSRGPIFFRQIRHGFNQQEFQIFKFRTMTTLENGYQFRQVQLNDERITRVGRFLRRTNLDELPQLFNVIKGEMSLVGPRPHAVAHSRQFEGKVKLYRIRHYVKPGITGWSQVNGYRGETDTIDKMQKRVEYDIFYIENWTFWFDIYILLRTIFSKKSYSNAF